MEEASPQKSVSQRRSLYLPNEILLRILTPLFGNSLEQLEHSRDESCGLPKSNIFEERFGETSYLQISPPLLEEDRVQVQLLRVCQQFCEVGISILYNNTLIFYSAMNLDSTDPRRKEQRRFLIQLSRPGRRRLRKIIIVLSTEYKTGVNFPESPIVLDEECVSLASHQPVWDQIYFHLMHQTIAVPWGLRRTLCGRLMYGLGRLHGREVGCWNLHKKPAEDICWAIRQPRHTIPLWHLHQELSQYLENYDPSDRFNRRQWTLKEFFIAQSIESANSRDSDRFYQNMEVAVDYIQTIVDQGLATNLRIFRREDQDVKNPAQKIVDRVRDEGQKLLNARRGIWDPIQSS